MDITTFESQDFPDHIPKLKTLYLDLFSGGKGFRAQLVNLVASNLDLSKEQQICLQKAIEYIHNSSLLHDDLIDQSNLRRGKTAAWLAYGPDHAVLAGDFLLAKVISLLCEQGNIKLVSYTAKTIMDLVEGEWHQDDLKTSNHLQSLELQKIHELKTASLKKWGLRAPFYLVGRTEKDLHQCLDEIGRLMGVLFQRSDDLIDYNIRNYEEKAILGDHRSSYINSFASHVLSNQNKIKTQDFLNAKNEQEIINLVGQEKWQELLTSFDNENSLLIKKYDLQITKLKSLLNHNEQKIATNLQPLGHLLYWRK